MADIEYKTITQVLEDFGNEMQDKLQKGLKKSIATGELYQSITFHSKIMGNKFHFVLDMGVDYWRWVDEGRKAGKQPPIKDILKWVNTKATFGGFSKVKNISDKRVQRGLAYVIARKIGEKGTKGNRFYSKVVTDERLRQLQRDLTRAASSDITPIIQKTVGGVWGKTIK